MPRLMYVASDHSLSFEDILNYCCLRSFYSNISLSCLVLVFSCVQLFATLWAVDCPALLFMGFCRQEYYSGLLFPFIGALPNPRIKLKSPVSPELKADSLPAELLGKDHSGFLFIKLFCKCLAL